MSQVVTGDRLVVVHVVGAGSLSGGARQAVMLSRGIGEAGHRVVFCAPADSPVLTAAEQVGLETRPMVYGKLRAQWKASRRLREIVREEGADLVHTHHTPGHNVGVLATFGGPFVPVVVKRGVLFRPKFPLKFRTPRVDAIITNTGAVRDVLARTGVPRGKIRVVYNAKELPDLNRLSGAGGMLREEFDLPMGTAVVGAAGNARSEKGFQFLVEAAPHILKQAPETLFVLMGAGTERFRERLAELGVTDRFRLPGHREDLLSVLALFDLFVFPGIDMDSCPNVLLEAMSVGLPVVGSDMPGMAEVIAAGEGTGRLVRAGDPVDLAEAVVAVLRDRPQLLDMGRCARQVVARRFHLAGRVGETLRVYEEVLGCQVHGAAGSPG